ncbi:MAG: trigger factor [Treponema sp.]|jgi:trigger factor|nr:trigger factor [Treponema sp.]
MPVSKTITRLEKSNVRLNLTVPKEDALSQYQDLLKDYAKNVQLPGFRRGKVPQNVLEMKFGEALKKEALGKIVEKALDEVFGDENLPKDEKPLPYAQPRMEDEPKLDFGNDLAFSLVYDVMPSVSVGNWKGLEAEVPDVTVSDEDIARELEELRDRNAFVLDRDDGAEARPGDVVTVDYCELDENGGVLPDSGREDFSFTLGSGQNVYDFDNDIAGMKKGEIREITKTYNNEAKKLKVTLKSLKEKKLPDLNDDLAQDIDEKFNTLDDLKKSIRERLEESLTNRIKGYKISKLLEKIMENTPVILPESMVMAEVEGRLRNLARQYGLDAGQMAQLLAKDGGGLGDLEGKWRPSAEKALHSRLIVEKIMEDQHIEAGDDEIEKEIESIVSESGMSREDVLKRYGGDMALEYFKDEVRERKLFDMLLAENNIKTGSKTNYLDFMRDNG